jgi:type IV secretory pathway TrbF-like protein
LKDGRQAWRRDARRPPSQESFTDRQMRSILAHAAEASVQSEVRREAGEGVEYTREEILVAGDELGVQRELVEAAILVSDAQPAEEAKPVQPPRNRRLSFALGLCCGVALGAGGTAVFFTASSQKADAGGVRAFDDQVDNLPLSDDVIKKQLGQFIVSFRSVTGDVGMDGRGLETTLDRVDGAARRTIFAYAIANNPATPRNGTAVTVESIVRVTAATNKRWLLTWTERTAETFGLGAQVSRWVATCHIIMRTRSQPGPGGTVIVLDQFQWAPAQ